MKCPTFLSFAACLALAALHASPLVANPPISAVRIDSGEAAGLADPEQGPSAFLGIPFVAAPVGDLRLRPPTRPEPWQGVRQADRFGAVCPQHGAVPQGLAMSEDCLTVNVWTAASSPRERRPVFVWIYGGGFNEGTAANPQFNGKNLARKGIVVVTFNYRLGPLGFLATPALSREGGNSASGNYGVLDQVALLQWVRRNIAAFGGDPRKVTIGGQSAGAGSVGFLAMSPLAKGLFVRAIAQSHARDPGDPELRYLSTSWRSLAAAERQGQSYADARGASTPQQLRSVPWQQLLEGSGASDDEVDALSPSKPPLFRPVVDGHIIPAGYAATFARGRQNRVNYIAGNNNDETGAVPEAAFAALRANTPALRGGMPTTHVTLAAYQAGARRKFGAMADEFFALYPAANDAEAALMNNAAARDNSRVSTFLWARHWRKHNPLPVFTYFWTRGIAGPQREQRGAFHGSEIAYVFGNLDRSSLPWNEEDRRVADTVSSYWANYVKTGNPNGPGLPAWPAWDSRRPQVMELGHSFAPIPVASPQRMAFWQRFFSAQTQW